MGFITNILKSGLKSLALSGIKKAVRAKGEELIRWCAKLKWWLGKCRILVAFLERLVARFGDGEFTNEEADAIISESKILADEILKPMPEET